MKSADDQTLPDNTYLLWSIFGGILIGFYLLIMWILSSAENDRLQRLQKLK
jgi:hypothetical protein